MYVMSLYYENLLPVVNTHPTCPVYNTISDLPSISPIDVKVPEMIADSMGGADANVTVTLVYVGPCNVTLGFAGSDCVLKSSAKVVPVVVAVVVVVVAVVMMLVSELVLVTIINELVAFTVKKYMTCICSSLMHGVIIDSLNVSSIVQ